MNDEWGDEEFLLSIYEFSRHRHMPRDIEEDIMRDLIRQQI